MPVFLPVSFTLSLSPSLVYATLDGAVLPMMSVIATQLETPPAAFALGRTFASCHRWNPPKKKGDRRAHSPAARTGREMRSRWKQGDSTGEGPKKTTEAERRSARAKQRQAGPTTPVVLGPERIPGVEPNELGGKRRGRRRIQSYPVPAFFRVPSRISRSIPPSPAFIRVHSCPSAVVLPCPTRPRAYPALQPCVTP